MITELFGAYAVMKMAGVCLGVNKGMRKKHSRRNHNRDYNDALAWFHDYHHKL